MKKRVSNVKKVFNDMREDRISVEKYPKFVAHNFRIEIKLKFCQFCCNQFRRYGN